MGNLLLLGCDEPPAPAANTAAPVPDGEHFVREGAGEVRGRVLWRGPVPARVPFRSIPQPMTDQSPPPPQDWPNPNSPSIDAPTAGLADAVVWLRNVDPAIGRPWDLPAVRVELKGQQFHVLQGSNDSRVGFVRAGDEIKLVSRDRVFHSIQGRGFDGEPDAGGKSAFFSHGFPAPHRVLKRRLERSEIVELASGCGYFWMRAYLFVSAHPYLARTDDWGGFMLPLVPAGAYEIVAWHPDDRVVQKERNPDNMRVQQVRFAPPLTSTRTIRIEAGKTTNVEMTLGR
jgi:hypothetical protein